MGFLLLAALQLAIIFIPILIIYIVYKIISKRFDYLLAGECKIFCVNE